MDYSCLQLSMIGPLMMWVAMPRLKMEILGFWPFDKLKVRMTSFLIGMKFCGWLGCIRRNLGMKVGDGDSDGGERLGG